MPTSKEYRQRAEDCLQLASAADDFFVRSALAELAADFEKMADGEDQNGEASERADRRL
jgi:hypothetical protein